MLGAVFIIKLHKPRGGRLRELSLFFQIWQPLSMIKDAWILCSRRIRPPLRRYEKGYRAKTIWNKLRGANDFTFGEAVKIKNRFFPEVPIEQLFEREVPDA